MTPKEYENLQVPFFKSAILNLTDSCNCNCRYCFMDFDPSQMTFETAKKSIDWLYRVWLRRIGLLNQPMTKNNLPNLTFFGGEPMLRWDDIIIPSLEYIQAEINPKIKKLYPEGYMGTTITTNGTLLTPDRIRLLRTYNCHPLLSIDGNKETQDYNRPLRSGESSFDKIQPNLPYLMKYFPQTTFRSTVIPDTVDLLFDNFMFAVNSGFTNYFVTPNKYEVWSQEKIDQLQERMNQIGLMILFYAMEGYFIHFSLLDNALKNIFSNKVSTTTIRKCGLGTHSISIGTDGTLFGCQEEASKPSSVYRIGHLDTGIDPTLHLNLLNQINEGEVLRGEKRDCASCVCNNYCASNYCTVSNLAIAGDPCICPEIECQWKIILHNTAMLMLTQAEKENSAHFQQYLLDLINK